MGTQTVETATITIPTTPKNIQQTKNSKKASN